MTMGQCDPQYTFDLQNVGNETKADFTVNIYLDSKCSIRNMQYMEYSYSKLDFKCDLHCFDDYQNHADSSFVLAVKSNKIDVQYLGSFSKCFAMY